MNDQLREIPRVRQIKGEPRRRWFSAGVLDLIVWLDRANRPSGFQLCHGVGTSEHALTWHPEKGFDYARVDSGEQGHLSYKGTPILQLAGTSNLAELRRLFDEASGDVPEDVRGFVVQALSSGAPSLSRSEANSSKSRRRK